MKELTTQEISSVSAAGAVLTDVGIATGVGAGVGSGIGLILFASSGKANIVLPFTIIGAFIGAATGTALSLLHEYDVI
jgi:hypothetical protein